MPANIKFGIFFDNQYTLVLVLGSGIGLIPEPNTNTAGCTIKVLVLPLGTHQTELETELFKYNL